MAEGSINPFIDREVAFTILDREITRLHEQVDLAQIRIRSLTELRSALILEDREKNGG